MSSSNPWSVNNIQEFWFLTCPECSFKTKEENKFQDHAVENHPQSFELFRDNSKEFEDKLKIVDVEDEASDLDNDQLDHQYKKREIKPRSNWNKKSASPYCESLTARMQPADFGDPKLFKYRTTSKVHLNRPNLIYLNRPHSNDTNLKQISCDHCNFKSFTMYDIENHMKSYCPRRQIFTCSDCKEDFSQKKNLTAHMQSAHGRKRLFFDFKCPECNFSAMNKSGLMNHIRMSHL